MWNCEEGSYPELEGQVCFGEILWKWSTLFWDLGKWANAKKIKKMSSF